MQLEEAMAVLNECKRWELRDHAFGDTEITWTKDDQTIASGYFGGSNNRTITVSPDPGRNHSFEGEEAENLRKCGSEVEVGRNDETGPDTYAEGEIMPGLSKGDVFHELTDSYLDE